MTPSRSIILYDGTCGFCSRTVSFVAERDPRAAFRFAPAQSNLARKYLEIAGLPPGDLDTVVLIHDDEVFTKSTAALRIARGLRMPWPMLGVFLAVPRALRDSAYDLVARNRHRLLPPLDHCAIPSAIKDRLLDSDA